MCVRKNTSPLLPVVGKAKHAYGFVCMGYLISSMKYLRVLKSLCYILCYNHAVLITFIETRFQRGITWKY